METIIEEYENNNSHFYDSDDITTDEEEEVQEQDDEESAAEEYSSCGGGNLGTKMLGSSSKKSWLQEWDHVFPLISALCLFLDPTFFYTLSLNEDGMCFFIDSWFALGLSLLRSVNDALHIWNMWHHYRRSTPAAAVHGVRRRCGGIALQNFKGKMVFFLNAFVLLPLPQVRNFFMKLLSIDLNSLNYSYNPNIHSVIYCIKQNKITLSKFVVPE